MVGGRPGLTQTSLLSRILNVDSNLYISTNAYVVGAQKNRLNLRERERERERVFFAIENKDWNQCVTQHGNH